MLSCAKMKQSHPSSFPRHKQIEIMLEITTHNLVKRRLPADFWMDLGLHFQM